MIHYIGFTLRRLIDMEKKITLVNKTPHPVTLVLEDGAKITLEPVLPTPRVTSSSVKTANYVITDDNGVEHTITRETPVFGEVVDLPEPQEGVLYIVSMLVAARASNRTDLVSPGRQLRNEAGQVIGCTGLQGKEGEVLL